MAPKGMQNMKAIMSKTIKNMLAKIKKTRKAMLRARKVLVWKQTWKGIHMGKVIAWRLTSVTLGTDATVTETWNGEWM
jgi:ribosomal protein L13